MSISKAPGDDEVDDYEYSDMYEFTVPDSAKKYVAYVFGQGEDFDTELDEITSKGFNKLSSAKQFLLQVYSQVNDMTPFVVTGSTSSYKDTGGYGPAIEITHRRIKKIGNDYDRLVGFVMSHENDIISSLSITPPE